MRIKTMQRTFSTLRKIMSKANEIKLDALDQDISQLQVVMEELHSIKDNEEADSFAQKVSRGLEDKFEELVYMDKIHDSLDKKLNEI